MHSINYDDVISKASIVALASPLEIRRRIPQALKYKKSSPDDRQKYKEEWQDKNPKKQFYTPEFKTGKKPAYSWSHIPRGYKGYADDRYGSGVICDFIPEYDLYLAVIDLDVPKNEKDVPIDDLVSVCSNLITSTHTRRTPSGGYHIYLLSRKKPKMKKPNFNLDYQTNTGNLKGKYVVCNYRYATLIDGKVIDLDEYYKENPDFKVQDITFEKEVYTHYKDSPQTIMVVDSVDEKLSEILSEIETLGLWTPPAKKKAKVLEQTRQIKTKKNQEKLVQILQNYVREGTRDELAKALSGYLYKKGYNLKECLKIFKQVFHNDEEIDHRLDFLERTFEKPKKEVAGITALKQLISPNDIETIKSVVEKQKKPSKNEIDSQIWDIDERIGYYLENDYPIIDKMIIESVEKNNTLFFDPSTLNYYIRKSDESIRLIDGDDIVSHVNFLFGANEISRKQCHRSLNFVTRFIKREPYVLEFTNGLLCINNEDNTFNFKPGEYCTDFIPNIKFPFRWNPEAKGGEIEKSVNSLLKTSQRGFEDNIKTYFKCIGHSCMGTIEKAIFPIILGRPGTGKSTLLTILKRFLTYSEVPIPDIIKNDRFSLTPAVGKDINIDDDLQSGVWKGIGKLNTFISGNGGSVEVKGENDRLQLTTYNTPKLWGASNALPPVIGDGFERRLILILADNVIPTEEMNDSFQTDIMRGMYDEGLEWLVYQSITSYVNSKREAFVKESHKRAMINEHNSKSDPLKTAIELIFRDSEDSDLEVKVVHREIKKWFKYAIREGKIFAEHKQPSVRQMDSAMNRAGYSKTRKSEYVDDERKQYTAFEDIKFNKDWLKLCKMFFGDEGCD